MDPSTPIWLSDDEDTPMTPSSETEEKLPQTLDECVDPYDQTKDYEYEESNCVLIAMIIEMVQTGDLEGLKKASKRSDWGLIWKHNFIVSTAIDAKQYEVIRFLVQNCPDDDYLHHSHEFNFGWEFVPITAAVIEGDARALTILLEEGIKVEHPHFNDPPIQAIALYSDPDLDLIKVLHRKGFWFNPKHLAKYLEADKPEIVEYVFNKYFSLRMYEERRLPDKMRAKLLKSFAERQLNKCIEFVNQYK